MDQDVTSERTQLFVALSVTVEKLRTHLLPDYNPQVMFDIPMFSKLTA